MITPHAAGSAAAIEHGIELMLAERAADPNRSLVGFLLGRLRRPCKCSWGLIQKSEDRVDLLTGRGAVVVTGCFRSAPGLMNAEAVHEKRKLTRCCA